MHGIWARASMANRVALLLLSFICLEYLDLVAPGRFCPAKSFLVTCGGAGTLAVALCSRRVGLALNHRTPAWLGRISYSLYLIHATVLFGLVHLFLGKLTRIQLLAPYLICALGIAALFYEMEE